MPEIHNMIGAEDVQRIRGAFGGTPVSVESVESEPVSVQVESSVHEVESQDAPQEQTESSATGATGEQGAPDLQGMSALEWMRSRPIQGVNIDAMSDEEAFERSSTRLLREAQQAQEQENADLNTKIITELELDPNTVVSDKLRELYQERSRLHRENLVLQAQVAGVTPHGPGHIGHVPHSPVSPLPYSIFGGPQHLNPFEVTVTTPAADSASGTEAEQATAPAQAPVTHQDPQQAAAPNQVPVTRQEPPQVRRTRLIPRGPIVSL